MCIPHASSSSFSAEKKERKKSKKYIEFDKKRLEPDPEFIDERTKTENDEEATSLFDEIKSFFNR